MEEAFVAEVIGRAQGKIALDIGANFGCYTTELAKTFEKVYAFEPLPANLVQLHSVLSGVQNVEVVEGAISDHFGSCKLYVNGQNAGGNSISEVVAEAAKWGHSINSFIDVPCWSLDYFCKDMKIDFIKMDIEGAENYVWNGAIETLKENKLTIILEVHQTVECEKLFNFFKGLGYTIEDYQGVVDHMENDRHYLIHN